MDQKTVVFRKGDVIVSGMGNIGIFNGVVDGFIGERLTAYCESSAPAGTDLRYARHATEAEKKIFFNALEMNGYTWNPDTFTIDANEDCVLTVKFDSGWVNWKADGMHPFKVVTGEKKVFTGEKKKRVRATWKQVRELEAALAKKDELLEGYEKQVDRDSRLLHDMQAVINKLQQEVDKLTIENERLRNRSFIERIINK